MKHGLLLSAHWCVIIVVATLTVSAVPFPCMQLGVLRVDAPEASGVDFVCGIGANWVCSRELLVVQLGVLRVGA